MVSGRVRCTSSSEGSVKRKRVLGKYGLVECGEGGGDWSVEGKKVCRGGDFSRMRGKSNEKEVGGQGGMVRGVGETAGRRSIQDVRRVEAGVRSE